MLADGSDATVVNVVVTDKDGREVPDAQHLVKFTVSGNAVIIGTGNGDPSSHEQDGWKGTSAQRSFFNGKCQLILQAARTPGDVKITAEATGLTAGGVTIRLLANGAY
jgi:beta-galactosidase